MSCEKVKERWSHIVWISTRPWGGGVLEEDSKMEGFIRIVRELCLL